MKEKLKEIIFSTYILIFIFLISILIVLNSTFIYRIFISLFNLEKYTGISPDNLMIDYKRIINYLNNPFNNNLEFENFSMSYNGAYHFLEVKNIIFKIQILFIAFCIIALVLYKMKKRNAITFSMEGFEYLFNITSIIFILLLVGFCFDFSYIFEKFHKILFNNDYWIFDKRVDPIITALPEEYFLVCGVICILFILGTSLILRLTYIRYKRKNLNL